MIAGTSLARSQLDRRGGEPFRTEDVPRAELFADVAAASLA